MNPYFEFKKWLCDEDLTSELDETVVKVVNPLSVIGLFLNYRDIFIYLNDTYNKYILYNYNKLEFFKFVKQIVYNNKISDQRNFSYISMKSNKEELNEEIMKLFPLIKNYECNMITDNIFKDEEVDSFLESIKVKKSKKAKQSKKSKKNE